MTSSQKHRLHVSERQELGKKVSQLRKIGLIPANIFGGAEKPQAVSLKKTDINRFIATVGESTLVYLTFEGSQKEVPALIDELQIDPVTSELKHVALKRVRLDEKVRAEVPLELIGEALVRGGNILLVKDMLEVEALPADLPEKITLDITKLTEVGQTMTLADANFDSRKVIVLLSQEELTEPLVIVQEQKEEEVEEAPVQTEEEGLVVEPEGVAEGEEAAKPAEKSAEDKK